VSSCSADMRSPVDWRLRVDESLLGAENMRIDQELLDDQRRPGALPVLRFFRWKKPTLSYGRLQEPRWVSAVVRSNPGPVRVLAAAGRAPDPGNVPHVLEMGNDRLDVVRRPTGGGIVYHRKDLSLSLAWRRDHPAFPKCLKDIYRAVHKTVQTALKQRNIDAVLHQPTAGAKGEAGFCFTEPAEDDLIWDGRKVLGGALRVTHWGRLYQGHLLTQPLGLDSETFIANLAAVFENYFFQRPPQHTWPGRF
jgi:lipoate-protein ligase A